MLGGGQTSHYTALSISADDKQLDGDDDIHGGL